MRPDPGSTARGALVLVAIGAALAAQQLVVRPPHALFGWMVFAAAGLLLAGATRSGPRQDAAPGWSGPVVYGRRLLWGVGALAAVAATVWLSWRGTHSVLAVLSWMAGFGLASLALRGSMLSTPVRAPVPWSRREAGVVAAILLMGLAARVMWIDQVPRYYFDDEPRLGLSVQAAFRQGIPNLFTTGFRSWSAPVPDLARPEVARAEREDRRGKWTLASMAMAVQAAFAPWLGVTTTALRLASALVGMLAILATYLLARELFTPRIAVLAALLFACGRTAIDFSRLGVPPVQVAFSEALAFACWWRAVNRGSGLAYLWAGIGLALCMTTYNAGHFVPPLWAGWIGLCLLVAPRVALRHWRGALVTTGAFFLAAAPYLLHVSDCLTFRSNWEDYTGGARERHIGADVLEAWEARGADAAWTIVQRQAERAWLGFGVIPSGAYGLGYRGGGMLDDVSAPLFVLGLIFAVCNLRRPRAGFLVYWWLATTAVLGVLTAGAPAFLRLTGLLPVLAMFAALPLDSAIRAAPDGGPGRTAVRAAVGVLLAAMAWDNWRTYFVAFPRQTRQLRADVARYLATVPPDTTALMAGADPVQRFGAEVFRLDFPGRRFENVGEPAHLLPLRTSAEAPVALIFTSTQLPLVEYALTLYPDAAVTDVYGGDDPEPMFRALLLSPAQIAARQGLRLEVHDGRGRVLQSAVADPFGPVPPAPEACAEVTWSGGVYWPTDAAAALTLRGGRTMSLADRVVRTSGDAAAAVRVAVQLPRGWHPVSITDACAPPQPLELAIDHEGVSRLLLTRALRPDGAGEGLRAAEVGAIDTPFPRLPVAPPPTPVALPPGSRLPLTDLQPTEVAFGYAHPWIDQSWGGGPVSIRGHTYARGIGMHAGTRMTYPVPPNAVAFESVGGLSTAVKACPLASVRFEIRDARDRLLYDSGIVAGDAPAQRVRAGVAGTPTITLIVTDAGDGFDCDHADWGEPAFVIE